MYSDDEAAALYDVINTGRPDYDFYLELMMEANAVLDVGCGTGSLLHRAREAGHAGRLCGLDPDAASLHIARRRGDVEWTLGVAASIPWEREFDLATMTGHAFQVLLTDEEIATSLSAIDAAGRPVRVSHEVESVVGDLVTITETTSEPRGQPLRVDRASLRFLDVEALASFLADAGFEIDAQYGAWDRRPLAPDSPEIITIARVP